MEQALLLLVLFGTSFASGIIPIINAELLLIGAVVSVTGPSMIVLVVVVASLGQMAAKTAMFFGASQATRFLGEKKMAKLDKYKAKLEKHQHAPGPLVFVSSLVGLPPLYVVSILAGALSVTWWKFFVAGLAGRLLRFGGLAFVPNLFSSWF